MHWLAMILAGIAALTAIVYYLRWRWVRVIRASRDTLIGVMIDAVLVVDNHGKIVEANLAAADLALPGTEPLVGRDCAEAIRIDGSLFRSAPTNQEVELGGATAENRRYFDLQIAPVHARRGRDLVVGPEETSGWLVVLREATTRRKLARALAASEAKYREVAERASDGILVIQDGLVKYANARLSMMAGRPVESIVGQDFALLFDQSVRELIRELAGRRLRGEPVPAHYEARLADTNDGPVLVEIDSGLMEFEGRPAILSFARDIAERKRAENAEREAHHMTESLRLAGVALSATLEYDQVLDLIVEQVGRVVQHDQAWILLAEAPDLSEDASQPPADPEQTESDPAVESPVSHQARLARLVRWRGVEIAEGERPTYQISDVPALREMAETGRPIVMTGSAAAEAWLPIGSLTGPRSIVATPIVGGSSSGRVDPAGSRQVEESLIGFIWLARSNSSRNTADTPAPCASGGQPTRGDSDSALVPTVVGGEPRMATGVGGQPQAEYTREHAEYLAVFAGQAALALANARLFAELQRLATTDPLTGVHNVRRFFELAKVEFDRSLRYRSPLSAIMLDLDRFKLVNDTFGHAAGDEALRMVAAYSRNTLRSMDIFGRYGGEEFVILLPETRLDAAVVVAERLRQQIESAILDTDEGLIRVTISLGVAELDQETPRVETLVRRADQALYRAKQAGRNRTEAA